MDFHRKTKENSSSLILWIICICTIFFLFTAPFYKGLFVGLNITFDGPLFSFMIVSSLLLLLLSIYLLFHTNLIDKKEQLGLVFVWVLPILYFVSSINSASPYSAENIFNLNVTYSIFFLIGLFLYKNTLAFRVLSSGLLLSLYCVVMVGFANLFGNMNMMDAVMGFKTWMRITSVFQYANTYSAVLVGLLFSSLFLITNSENKYRLGFISAMIVPIIISFILTDSRGGLLMAPIVLLCLLPFLSPPKQIIYLINLILGATTSFLVLKPIKNISIDIRENFWQNSNFKLPLMSTESLMAWGLLLLGSTAMVIFSLLINHFFSPKIKQMTKQLTKFKFNKLILPSALVIIFSVLIGITFSVPAARSLLPASISSKIEKTNLSQNSVLERLTFYRDTAKFLKDQPIIGAGGGAWAALYEKYQSNPYESRQAHNFFLQLLTEVGLLGFIILLSLIIYVYYHFIRRYNEHDSNDVSKLIYFIITTSILVHSAIDFDMSFAYISALVFMGLGIMISKPLINTEAISLRFNYIYTGFLLFVSILLLVSGLDKKIASNFFNKSISAAQNRLPFNEVLASLDKSIEMQPKNIQYISTKANMLSQAYSQTKNDVFYIQMKNLILEAQQIEPSNRIIIEQKLAMHLQKKEFEQAVGTLENALEYFPWDSGVYEGANVQPSFYERLISLTFELGKQANLQGDINKSNMFWDKAISNYNIVLSKVEQLKKLPAGQQIGRDFRTRPKMTQCIGEIYYYRKDYEKAEQYFKTLLPSDNFDNLEDQEKQIAARWYLVSLQKQRKNDIQLYNKLIAVEPKERDEIINLLNNNVFNN
ncbi:O-antigen ligase family protein [Paenibacillus aurantius]|uniref:O-antigen ligase family protein n=1 Tax=Paenibacillus aurantius TaxID=2918900 RepID=A0AA96LB84_9BACL|nr:O-antigen ligase family protein [Paenibacillus aurantius]WNQ10432.1 O-antigen ligase family protein [Paenibacillus aurantius]